MSELTPRVSERLALATLGRGEFFGEMRISNHVTTPLSMTISNHVYPQPCRATHPLAFYTPTPPWHATHPLSATPPLPGEMALLPGEVPGEVRARGATVRACGHCLGLG